MQEFIESINNGSFPVNEEGITPDVWSMGSSELDQLAAATPSEQSFLKKVIAHAANEARVREAESLYIGDKEVMKLAPNKTSVFCTKAVDIADLVFIRSLGAFNPFAPKMKAAAFQACATQLQASFTSTQLIGYSMPSLGLTTTRINHRRMMTQRPCLPSYQAPGL